MSVDQVAPPPEEEHVDPFALFSPQIQIAVRGLTFIGHLEREIEFCGHTFSLRTLYPSEKAAAAIAIQPWRGTIEEASAWTNVQVGLSLQSVDNVPDFCDAIGPDLNEFARARLNFVNKWHQPTLSYLYARYLELESEALDGIRELRDLSERNRAPSQPSPDSLIVPDTLGAEIGSDIQP